jgi:hypothetical protein
MKEAKMQYEYELQGNYGYGWDVLTTEATRSEALDQLRTYAENEPMTRLRISRVRVKAVA